MPKWNTPHPGGRSSTSIYFMNGPKDGQVETFEADEVARTVRFEYQGTELVQAAGVSYYRRARGVYWRVGLSNLAVWAGWEDDYGRLPYDWD